MEHAGPVKGKVRMEVGAHGAVTYLIDMLPAQLPPVRARDLERAWYAARAAAIAEHWGILRGFRFRRPDGSFAELALADRDACCWAGAVDQVAGLSSLHGMSLCLRLLALVDLLGRAAWAAPLCRLDPDGADLHPALLRAAAAAPLTDEARFDETGFQRSLAALPVAPPPAPPPGVHA